MSRLTITDLHVRVEDKEILKGVSLTLKSGEIHALMGPNGNGKSTLLAAIMGHPRYTVTQGDIFLDDVSIKDWSVDQRSKAGLFLGMQTPQEISGVTNADFLKAAINARREQPIALFPFIKAMEAATKKLGMKEDLAHRFLNEGFSGGEKKRNEILQMVLLKPKFALLDEIDSGLDVDALKVVSSAILDVYKEESCGLLIVSHYGRFYDLVTPTHVHVLAEGVIIAEGDKSLADQIDAKGYDLLLKQHGVEIKKEREKAQLLGTCARSKK
ncbi:MAG: Fe-S cluster assembly ATPase SufC [Erysipelotrichaceae bacterium]|jgi:Fe-S cluster assembly ATP-binding protein|nr:Fe-S cluster assembly ATPase SufC [Erysipelotrichaceae bacterium]